MAYPWEKKQRVPSWIKPEDLPWWSGGQLPSAFLPGGQPRGFKVPTAQQLAAKAPMFAQAAWRTPKIVPAPTTPVGIQARQFEEQQAKAIVDIVNAPSTPEKRTMGVTATEGVDYAIIGGNIVPIVLDADGNPYYDFNNAMPIREKEEEKAPTTYPREPGQPETWTDNNGIIWSYDADKNDYVKIGYDPDKDQEAIEDRAWREKQLKEQKRQWEAELAWSEKRAGMEAEQEKQARLAQLRANPASWLEYASLAGTQPAIQPWMLPLMPQQYAGMTAGQPLPGWGSQATSQITPTGAATSQTTPTGAATYRPEDYWLQPNPMTGNLEMVLKPSAVATTPTATTTQTGATSLAGLPQLTSPSRQYQARMGPTAMAQYGGYEQARTGITPEEMQWRLWSSAPPSGRYSRMTWAR